jgi:hypothetical protein
VIRQTKVNTGVISFRTEDNLASQQEGETIRAQRIMNDVVMRFGKQRSGRKFNPRYARVMESLKNSPAYRVGKHTHDYVEKTKKGHDTDKEKISAKKQLSFRGSQEILALDVPVRVPEVDLCSSGSDSSSSRHGWQSILQRRQQARESQKGAGNISDSSGSYSEESIFNEILKDEQDNTHDNFILEKNEQTINTKDHDKKDLHKKADIFDRRSNSYSSAVDVGGKDSSDDIGSSDISISSDDDIGSSDISSVSSDDDTDDSDESRNIGRNNRSTADPAPGNVGGDSNTVLKVDDIQREPVATRAVGDEGVSAVPQRRVSLATRIRRNREAIRRIALKKKAQDIEDSFVLNVERRRSSSMAHQNRAHEKLHKRIAKKVASKDQIDDSTVEGKFEMEGMPIRRLRSRDESGYEGNNRPGPINKLSSFEIFTEKAALVSNYTAHQALLNHSLESQRRDSKVALDKKRANSRGSARK